jgi:hypothetical protein
MKKYIKSEYAVEIIEDPFLPDRVSDKERQIVYKIFHDVCYENYRYGYYDDDKWVNVLWRTSFGDVICRVPDTGYSCNNHPSAYDIWFLVQVILKMKPSEFIDAFVCRKV